MLKAAYFCLLSVGLFSLGLGYTCHQRSFGYDSFTCACNATHCDTPGPWTTPTGLNFTRIVTSRDQYRFAEFSGTEESTATGTTTVVVNHTDTRQVMRGFGGGFTDATGQNIRSLTQPRRTDLLNQYFGDTTGLQYNMARIPIGGTDFSSRAYAYNDDYTGDVNQTNWSLTFEDLNYKIPIIQEAMSLTQEEIYFYGSPFSPSPWMKTNNDYAGDGQLIDGYEESYAIYLRKFIQAYETKFIPIYGITPQNEPTYGCFGEPPSHSLNQCCFNATMMRDLIKDHLGPELANNNLNTKIFIHDFRRGGIPSFTDPILNDSNALTYVDGISIHWYDDWVIGPQSLIDLRADYPSLDIIHLESCDGWNISDTSTNGLRPGQWDRANNHIIKIIENIRAGTQGWVDWNMALDDTGGPNWAETLVDAPIFVIESEDAFFKNAQYYALGHFSMFVDRGAEVLGTTVNGDANIDAVGFHNPNGDEVVVVSNSGATPIDLSIETHAGEYANFQIGAYSFESILYHPDP